jgi:secreted PhoX family phosphatase
MSIHRRRFLKSIAAGASSVFSWGDAFAALDAQSNFSHGFGPLIADSNQVLDLPQGFKYSLVAQVGAPMSDGFRVPGLPDSMSAFKGPAGRMVLLCNHELNVNSKSHAFTGIVNPLSSKVIKKIYDPAVGKGGVSTLIINEKSLQVEQHFLSLAGTLRNCSGGVTPWGSWLSCEESVVKAGESGAVRDHGYVFDVSATSRELQTAHPLTALGRFNHEAAVVDPNTGIVYLTEDRGDSLLYRFLPYRPGELRAGGRLQALSIIDLEGGDTSNRSRQDIPLGMPVPVRWVSLDNVQAPEDDLRLRGRDLGASRFVRGEGMVVQTSPQQRSVIWFMATSGGPKGLGQVWRYLPSKEEGNPGEAHHHSQLELFLEPANAAIQNHGDNLALAPNGDLIICEDSAAEQRILGVTPQRGVYLIARNPRGDSELTGATFSPSGQTMFVNIQHRGLTLAIQGDWMARRG